MIREGCLRQLGGIQAKLFELSGAQPPMTRRRPDEKKIDFHFLFPRITKIDVYTCRSITCNDLINGLTCKCFGTA